MILIRHGATDANDSVPYILQGRSLDLDLNKHGIQQAKQTAYYLANEVYLRGSNFDKIYCSPMKRAIQTAQLIADSLKLTIEITSDLIECSLGKWEGLTWEEIERKYYSYYQWFIGDTGFRNYPEGESYHKVLERVKPVLSNLEGQNVVVVSHGIVCKAYLCDKMNIPLWFAKSLPQSNCGINLIQDSLTINYTGHLL